MKRTLPAYPLFVKDPYFSIWADNEYLNHGNPIFWVGDKKVMSGYVEMDGKKLVFLGESDGSFTQKYIKTEGFITEAYFSAEELDLKLEFVSPLFPDDYDVLSCPVCYLKYTAYPKRDLKNAKICFEVDERICFDTTKDANRTEETVYCVLAFDKFESAQMGRRQQHVFATTGDALGCDWGYWYVAGTSCFVEMRDNRRIARAENSLEQNGGFFMLGFDDVISIEYFGRPLVGYYFRDGKTMTDALEDAFDSAERVFARCYEYNESFINDWKEHGDAFVSVANASVVQIMGAHKLVRDYLTGKTLFISKECGSSGLLATMDVTYPSAPFFLKYNPDLVRGMLYPIFDFARTKIWTYPFAPHDVGRHPLARGQYYALTCFGDKYTDGMWNWEILTKFTTAKIHEYKINKGHFDYEKQMPVEESANALIVSCMAYLCDGKTQDLVDNYDLLQLWADYLYKNGESPENQLTSDDFCGRRENNINLAIKASLGLYAFSVIAKACGKDGEKELKKAKEIARKVESYGEKFTHLPESFDLGEGTYSLKYNLAYDLALGANLYKKETYEKEARCYLAHPNPYGVKLYSNIETTKSDWLAYVACFLDDKSYRDYIFQSIVKFMEETPERVPFSDWYNVETAKLDGTRFRARSVQGGLFMPLLIK